MGYKYRVDYIFNPCPFCNAEYISKRARYIELLRRGIECKEPKRPKHDIRLEPAVLNPEHYIVKCFKCGAITKEAPTREQAYHYWQTSQWSELTILLANPAESKQLPAYKTLRNAIVQQAFYDLKHAIADRYRKGRGQGMVAGEYWFRSPELAVWTDIPGEEFIKAARKQTIYDIWRHKHGCKYCHRTSCIHSKRYPWKSFDPNTATCKREVDASG